jgi:hypothetical protein
MTRTIRDLTFGLVLAALSLSSSACEVVDATLYLEKPDEIRVWLREAPIFYVRGIWSSSDIQADPSEALLREQLASFSSPRDLILDLEHWDLSGTEAAVRESIRKYKLLAAMTKKLLPRTRIGYYGVVPARDYWRAQKGAGSKEYQQWQRYDDIVAEVVPSVDVLYPSLYTFYDDVLGWDKYLVANVDEARRVANGRPVYVFLWPEFHDSSALKGQFLSAKFWRHQLEFACSRADGIVIWGGWDTRINRKRVWDPKAPWWLETMKFLQSEAYRGGGASGGA